MDLQVTKIEKAEKLEVLFFCPGLTKDELTISFDKKEGVLEINGKPKEDTLSEIMDLEVSGKISVSPKYRSESVEASVINGIAKVEFGLAKEVNIVKFK